MTADGRPLGRSVADESELGRGIQRSYIDTNVD
jgi:hypothetical protein